VKEGSIWQNAAVAAAGSVQEGSSSSSGDNPFIRVEPSTT